MIPRSLGARSRSSGIWTGVRAAEKRKKKGTVTVDFLRYSTTHIAGTKSDVTTIIDESYPWFELPFTSNLRKVWKEGCQCYRESFC